MHAMPDKTWTSLAISLFVLTLEVHVVLSCSSSSLSDIIDCFLWAQCKTTLSVLGEFGFDGGRQDKFHGSLEVVRAEA